MKINTFIVPIIQDAFLPRMLETLYRCTEKDSFNVIVIDNTGKDDAYQKCGKQVHMWIKPYRNLGFSKSMNTGIRLTDTKYVTLANDDIEFISPLWWKGILDTFASDPRIIAVNPMSPKEASWGYGHTAENHQTWQPKQGYVVSDETKEGIVPVIDGKPFLYKQEYTTEEYEGLLKRHPTWSENSCCDAIAMWCTVFRTEDLIGKNPRIGLLDERFYPGGGEDYQMNCEAYSCAFPYDREECDSDYHYRMVGSSRSWVYHHWGKSRDISAKAPKSDLFKGRERWNNNDELFFPTFDVWGHYEKDGRRKPIRRKVPKFIDEL